MPRKDPDAIRITSATQSRSHDVATRQRRYVISMTIRTLSFLLAVLVASWSLWLMWVFIFASFILPPVAVVIANANAPTDPDPAPDTVFDPSWPELGPPKES